MSDLLIDLPSHLRDRLVGALESGLLRALCEGHLVELCFEDDSCEMGRYREEDVLRWQGLVSEQVASGKSIAAFCGERGLRDWQFYEWKKRLRKAEAGSFVAVEVTVPAEPESSAPVSVQMVGIEIRHRRGWSLIVDPGFDARHLRRLLSVLEMES